MTNISTSFLLRRFGLDKPLLALRPHWIEVLPSLFLLIVGTFSLLGMLLFVILPLFPSLHLPVLLMGGVFICSCLGSLVIIGNWFFHGYMVTKERIIEFHCLPFLLYTTNGIMLHQVRCTEIDVSKNGLIQHLFDIGDITITFDRPTRQEQFTLTHVFHPEKVGNRLSEILDGNNAVPDTSLRWTRDPLGSGRLLFSQDLYPQIA